MKQNKCLKYRGTRHRAQKERGITLIALVITIILLLILAGVTIKKVLDNNFVNKAQLAVDKYSEQQAKEKLTLALINYRIGLIEREDVSLQEYLTEIGGTIRETEDDYYKVELDGYEFIIHKNGFEITSNGSINGEKPSINNTEVIYSEDKQSATIKVTASAVKGGKLTVKINEQIAELKDGTYNITVTKNGTYIITVEESGITRKETVSTEITEIVKQTYTVTIEKGEGISNVSPTRESVEEGENIEITATLESGYIFEKWEITSGTGTIENLTSASTTLKPTSNITIKATGYKPTKEITNGNNISGTENGTITGKKYAYNNPIIPVGFKTLDTTDAKWESTDGKTINGWNNGLVITDAEENGNEFVWVPVDGTNVTYIRRFIKIHNASITSLTQLSDDTLPSGVTSEQTQITKYGGFYIGRYEAGISSALTTALNTASAEARDVTGKPVTKKNQIPWNFISYTKSKANAERMYTGSNIKSGLVTGTMWDTVMLWLENSEVNVKTDSRDWGNYSNSAVTGITQYSPAGNYGASWTSVNSKTKPTGGSSAVAYRWLLKTGNSNYTKRKNIYDLAGNVGEWTNEAVMIKSTLYSVVRGGTFADEGTNTPGMYRRHFERMNQLYGFGFRVALYIQ